MTQHKDTYRFKGRAVFLAAIMVISVLAMPIAFAGGAAAQDVSANNYSDLEGTSVWQGQEIEVGGFDAREDVQLRERIDEDTTRLRDELRSDGDGNVTFETDNRDEGDYFLRGPGTPGGASDGTDVSQTFEINEQSLSAEFDDDEVSDTGDNAITEIEFDSNRGSYDLNVSADGDLDVEELEHIFTTNSGLDAINNNSDDDDDTITLEGVDDDDFELNFTDIDAGEYEFDFEVDDSTASASDTIEVVEGDDGSLDISDATVTQGDIAEFTVEFDNAEEGVVFIGEEEDDGYQANISIDSDGEDEVTFYFNTYAAGQQDENEIVVADEDSDATVTLENFDEGAQTLSAILDSGDYEVGAYATSSTDTQAFVDAVDDPDTITTLTINERTDLDANLWRAGEDVVDDLLDELDDGDSDAMEFIGEGVENDLVTETDMFAVNDGDGNGASDYQIHQISADGLHGILGLEGDEPTQFDDLDTTASFQEALKLDNVRHDADGNDDRSLVFELEEQNPGSNQDPIEVNLNEIADVENLGEFATVVYDGDAGDYYVVIDTDALIDYVNDDANGIDGEIEEDQEYDVTFAVQDARLLDETDDSDDLEDLYEEINWEFDLDEAEGDFQNMNENDEVEIENSDAAEVSVDTNVAPGTELDIRLRNAQDTSPSFIKNDRDLVVSADGVVTGTFDMSEQSVDDELTASVRQASFELEEDGIVVDAVEEVDDDEADDEADDETDDMDDDMDDMDDEPVDTDDDDTVEETEDDTPGFGALVALLAVLGAAFLAVRRQN